MADPSFFVGIVGNIISILVFASPIGTFRRIVKNKSTEDFRWLPYVTTLLSTSLWTFYGLLKPGGLLIVTVNGAGAALEAVYVALYLMYAPKETKAKMAKLVLAVNVGVLAAVVVVALVALHGGVRLFAVGLLCAALTIGMYAAPMGAMVLLETEEFHGLTGIWIKFFRIPNGLEIAELCMQLMKKKSIISSGDAEDSGEEQERGVHAVLPVLLPLPQRWRLERLLHSCQGLLHRNPQRHRLRAGHGTAGAVRGVPEEEGGAQGRWVGGRGGRGGAPDGAGGDGAEAGAAAQGTEPAEPVVAVGAAPRARAQHRQGLLHHPRGAALRPAPARTLRVRERQGRGGERRQILLLIEVNSDRLIVSLYV